MLLSDFDFDLPDHLIARYPLRARRDSRLLVVEPDALSDRTFPDLPTFLNPGDLLVLNDTEVIPARFFGRKQSGGKVELLIERVVEERAALAHIKASKAPKPGSRLILDGDCEALVTERDGALYRLEFAQPVDAFLRQYGDVPLPPYLGREAETSDRERYQTVYARRPGAVAAPTAGLHFDEKMLADLDAVGVQHCFVTLHVGAGTFQSLRHENAADNTLHAERIEVGQAACDAINATRKSGGRVIAAGTTSVRALESASTDGEISTFAGESDLFIRPGYRFDIVDLLLTNFHLPRSSLLMLVAALAGRERILEAYAHAVAAEYRFFSYGDAMLVFPQSVTR